MMGCRERRESSRGQLQGWEGKDADLWLRGLGLGAGFLLGGGDSSHELFLFLWGKGGNDGLALALQRRVPVVLDGVVRPAREQLGNLRPSVAILALRDRDVPVLLLGPWVLSDGWVQLMLERGRERKRGGEGERAQGGEGVAGASLAQTWCGRRGDPIRSGGAIASLCPEWMNGGSQPAPIGRL